MMLTNVADIVSELERHLHTRHQQQASTSSMLSCHLRITQNSRDVSEGDVFVALKGHDNNGADYIDDAITRGAQIVLADSDCKVSSEQVSRLNDVNVAVIEVAELRSLLPEICKWFYLGAAPHLLVIGVTGTNGKTSITHLLAQLADLNEDGSSCAVIGTMGTGHFQNLTPSANTTPGITDVYYLLKQFANDKNNDFSHVAMEVSSHALAQDRVAGLAFDTAIFTNLSHEHLDYHGTMDAYFAEKAKLFVEYCPRNAVINVDDEYGLKLTRQLHDYTQLVAYGQTETVRAFENFVFLQTVECHRYGLRLILDWQIRGQKETTELNLPLFGDFNAMNIAAVFATAVLAGWPVEAMTFAELRPVPGRLELNVTPDQAIAIVDYAHTPDALKESLLAVKKHLSGKLWLVFGCGGDRDTSKRPLMASVAEKLSDRIVVTNDNPRTESQEHIVNDIMQGFQSPEAVHVEYDRKQAIEFALRNASSNDAILIAGKGHEDYQIVGTEKLDYDERAFVASLVKRVQD